MQGGRQMMRPSAGQAWLAGETLAEHPAKIRTLLGRAISDVLRRRWRCPRRYGRPDRGCRAGVGETVLDKVVVDLGWRRSQHCGLVDAPDMLANMADRSRASGHNS